MDLFSTALFLVGRLRLVNGEQLRCAHRVSGGRLGEESELLGQGYLTGGKGGRGENAVVIDRRGGGSIAVGRVFGKK